MFRKEIAGLKKKKNYDDDTKIVKSRLSEFSLAELKERMRFLSACIAGYGPVDNSFSLCLIIVCRSDAQRAQYLLLCLYLPLRFRDNQYVSSRNSSGKIEFHHVRLEHAGQYQCKMTNPQGGFVMSDTVCLTVGML